MKTASHVTGRPDRIVTRGELLQVMGLVEKVATDQKTADLLRLSFCLSAAETEGLANATGLWVDMAEEDASAVPLDASTELLAELFAGGGDRVN